jgi:hypothetical protein
VSYSPKLHDHSQLRLLVLSVQPRYNYRTTLHKLSTVFSSHEVVIVKMIIGFETFTVLMNLDLIDGPLLPHNLISVQESPAPLPNFQMAPDLKFNVLWVQERNQDILYFSLKTSRQAISFQVLRRGPYRDRYPLTGHSYISLGIPLYLKDWGLWLRGYHPVAPRPLRYGPFVHRL